MKKLALLSCLLISTIIVGGWLSSQNRSQTEQVPDLIRFHVRANSDSETDQALKLKVRDAILAKFSPVLAQSASLDASRELVKDNLLAMEQEADRVISSEGKDYSARVVYGYANFPVKSYGNFTLPAGRYEAVQILIGDGKGANWWCVLFPPLCFVDINTSVAHEPVVSNTINLQENSNPQEISEKDSKEDVTTRNIPKVKIKAVEVVKNWLHFTDPI